jgi:hypothetical protein
MQIRILLATLLLVAGCSYYQDAAQVEATIVAPGNFKAGPGVIEAVSVLPRANQENRKDPNLYRLSLRMNAGGFQTVDIDNGTFLTGEAVDLTNDGRVVRVSGTTLNDIVRQ